MSVQDKVERVLREFYVLYSRSEPYDKNADRVIVNKKEALALLEQLKSCMNEMMEEYEITSNSRERGEREARRRRYDIIWDANHKAEDIYAASVLYSNEALGHIQTIIQNATDEMEKMFHTAKKEMMKQQQTVRDNQLELKSSLEDLKDTDKYRKVIEERNKEIKKKKEQDSQKKVKENTGAGMTAFPAGKPEIKVNPAYFEKIGRPVPVPDVPETKAAPELDIKVNLDAEYFRWRQKKKADG